MKLDASFTHLVIFCVTLLCLVALVITGHDASATVNTLVGVVLGVTGYGSSPAVSALVTPSGISPSDKQGGYVHPRFAALLVAWCILGCLALSACAGLKTTGSTDVVATSCVTASAALKVLVVAKTAHALSASQEAAVTASLPTIAAVCTSPTEPTPSTASVTALVAVAAQLSAIAAPFEAPSTPVAN